MATKATAEAPRDELHLDDFLNSLEHEGKVELLGAYAYAQKRAGELKKTLDEWRADFAKFEKQTP